MSDNLLREALAEAASLLERVGEIWSSKIRQALARASIDRWAVKHWYGGMGSFSDLVISRANGHRIEPSAEGSLNKELRELQTKIYQLAEDQSD